MPRLELNVEDGNFESVVTASPRPGTAGDGSAELSFRDNKTGSKAIIQLSYEGFEQICAQYLAARTAALESPAGQHLERERRFKRSRQVT